MRKIIKQRNKLTNDRFFFNLSIIKYKYKPVRYCNQPEYKSARMQRLVLYTKMTNRIPIPLCTTTLHLESDGYHSMEGRLMTKFQAPMNNKIIYTVSIKCKYNKWYITESTIPWNVIYIFFFEEACRDKIIKKKSVSRRSSRHIKEFKQN